MNTNDNLEIALRKLEQEMHTDSQLLDKNKEEFKHITEEITTFKAENIKQKQAILDRERKIMENESRSRKLLPEIKKLEEKQRKNHMTLSKITIENKDRLSKHGIKIPSQHSL